MRLQRQALAGFTLIEVLVAIAILGILATIAIPAYTEHLARGRRAEGRAALLATLQQEERFFASNNVYTANLAANGFTTTSGENAGNAHYDLSAAACAGSTAAACVVVSATPRLADARCGTLTVSTAGARGSSVAGAAAQCWQR